jgi:Zn-dependent protease with chaperone function
MSWPDRDTRLYRIFRELQEKGLIDRRRRLIRCTFTPSIRGCPALNCIRYRRSFYEKNLSEASDDILRFVLLHEEGHARKGSSLLSALPALPVLLCFMFFCHPFLQTEGLPVTKPILIALLLLIAFFAYRTYYHRMCDEEFTADRYAADAMRRCYRVRDPGALLQNLLSALIPGAPVSCNRGLISALFRAEPNYRPSIAERVERVRDQAASRDRSLAAHRTGSGLSR